MCYDENDSHNDSLSSGPMFVEDTDDTENKLLHIEVTQMECEGPVVSAAAAAATATATAPDQDACPIQSTSDECKCSEYDKDKVYFFYFILFKIPD